MSFAGTYLEIARHHRDELQSLVPPFSHDLALRHALICSVFAAIAVEHALTELVWARAFLQTPFKYRSIAIQRAKAARTIPSKLEFVRAASELPDSVYEDINEISRYRNRLVHAQVKLVEGKTLDWDALVAIDEEGLGSEFDEASRQAARGDSSALDEFKEKYGDYRRSLELGALGTPDWDAALRNYEIAKAAVGALEGALNSGEWPVQTDGPADE